MMRPRSARAAIGVRCAWTWLWGETKITRAVLLGLLLSMAVRTVESCDYYGAAKGWWAP